MNYNPENSLVISRINNIDENLRLIIGFLAQKLAYFFTFRYDDNDYDIRENFFDDGIFYFEFVNEENFRDAFTNVIQRQRFFSQNSFNNLRIEWEKDLRGLDSEGKSEFGKGVSTKIIELIDVINKAKKLYDEYKSYDQSDLIRYNAQLDNNLFISITKIINNITTIGFSVLTNLLVSAQSHSDNIINTTIIPNISQARTTDTQPINKKVELTIDVTKHITIPELKNLCKNLIKEKYIDNILEDDFLLIFTGQPLTNALKKIKPTPRFNNAELYYVLNSVLQIKPMPFKIINKCFKLENELHKNSFKKILIKGKYQKASYGEFANFLSNYSK